MHRNLQKPAVSLSTHRLQRALIAKGLENMSKMSQDGTVSLKRLLLLTIFVCLLTMGLALLFGMKALNRLVLKTREQDFHSLLTTVSQEVDQRFAEAQRSTVDLATIFAARSYKADLLRMANPRCNAYRVYLGAQPCVHTAIPRSGAGQRIQCSFSG